jgi:hypothetical protein
MANSFCSLVSHSISIQQARMRLQMGTGDIFLKEAQIFGINRD